MYCVPELGRQVWSFKQVCLEGSAAQRGWSAPRTVLNRVLTSRDNEERRAVAERRGRESPPCAAIRLFFAHFGPCTSLPCNPMAWKKSLGRPCHLLRRSVAAKKPRHPRSLRILLCTRLHDICPPNLLAYSLERAGFEAMLSLSLPAALSPVSTGSRDAKKVQQQVAQPSACRRSPTRARLAAPRPQSQARCEITPVMSQKLLQISHWARSGGTARRCRRRREPRPPSARGDPCVANCQQPPALTSATQPSSICRSANNAVSAPSRFRNAFAQTPWWRLPRPANMRDVDSVQQLVDELAASAAAEQLVIVEVSSAGSVAACTGFAVSSTGCR